MTGGDSSGPHKARKGVGAQGAGHVSPASKTQLPKVLLEPEQVRALIGTDDAADVLAAVSQMGQKELQSKFHKVFGLTTTSTNNHWLRRKLLECCGIPASSFSPKGLPLSPSAAAEHLSTAADAGRGPSSDPRSGHPADSAGQDSTAHPGTPPPAPDPAPPARPPRAAAAAANAALANMVPPSVSPRAGEAAPSSGKGRARRRVKRRQMDSAPSAASAAVLAEAPGRLAVGRRIKVFWPEEREWFDGEVVAWSERDRRHKVAYDDGDTEDVRLETERFAWLRDPEGQPIVGDRHRGYSDTPSRGGVDGGEEGAVADPPPKEPGEMGPGDLVWGKVKGHGYWPGRVVDYRKHLRTMGQPPSKDAVLVNFFDHTVGWANRMELFDLLGRWDKFCGCKRTPAFTEALRLAEKAIQEWRRHLRRRRGGSSGTKGSGKGAEGSTPDTHMGGGSTPGNATGRDSAGPTPKSAPGSHKGNPGTAKGSGKRGQKRPGESAVTESGHITDASVSAERAAPAPTPAAKRPKAGAPRGRPKRAQSEAGDSGHAKAEGASAEPGTAGARAGERWGADAQGASVAGPRLGVPPTPGAAASMALGTAKSGGNPGAPKRVTVALPGGEAKRGGAAGWATPASIGPKRSRSLLPPTTPVSALTPGSATGTSVGQLGPYRCPGVPAAQSGGHSEKVDAHVRALEGRYSAAVDVSQAALEARLAMVRGMLAATEAAEERLRARMAAEATLQERALAALRTGTSQTVAVRPVA